MPAKTSKTAAKQQQTTERYIALCRAATLNATRESTIPFGANVTRPQIVAVESLLKGRDILKFLACTEKQLRAYSRNEISVSQLPAKTQERLRQINAVYAKPWARKSATIAYTLHRERKTNARKRTPKPTPQTTPDAPPAADAS